MHVFHIDDSLSLTFEDIKDKDEEEVYRMFYPDKHAVENMYKEADYEYVHKGLKKVGVTLKLLHKEYCDRCKTVTDIPMGYTKFCDGYTDFTIIKTGVTMHPKQGDIILNDNYEALGSHYMTAIMPTGVRKPKQKASVEGTVGKVATAIIAKLRNKML